MSPTGDQTPVRPVYGGPGIAGLVPALIGGRAAPWLPKVVADASTVVLLVLDGLGWEAVTEHAAQLPTVAALAGGPITTVVPSTTASALTSISTGLAPGQHGIVGFRMRVERDVLNVLSWRMASDRKPPDPFSIQRHPPFLGRSVPVVTKAEFRRTGFTEAHLRDTRFTGWHAVSSLVESCRRLAASGEPFVYGYYPSIDSVAHAHGLHDGFYEAELAAADRLVSDVLNALPPSAALLVTSDHGQVHIDPDGWLGLGAVADLVDACSGDARFRYLHARKGMAADLEAAARAEFSSRAWVFSRDELLDGGWLGPVEGPAARRRVGDVVLAARDPVAFIDPTLPREAKLLSAHGSMTPAEMWVPLLAGRGRA